MFFSTKRKPEENGPDPRIGFVLLNSPEVDWDLFIQNMKDDWSIQIDEKPDGGLLMFQHSGMMVNCLLVKVPVQNNEAVENAKNNYLWREAVEVVTAHKAHIMVAVVQGDSPIDQSLLYTKVSACLLKQKNVTSIYQYPTVLPKDFYLESAQDMKDNCLPYTNWVYVGIYPEGKKFSGYTYGLDYFGKDEVEIIKSKEHPSELYSMLYSIVSYVLINNITFHDGETIGFTEEQKLKLKRSKGVAVEKDSIKVTF